MKATGVSRDSPYRDVPAAPRLAFSQGQPSTTSTGTSWASQALQRGPSNKDPLTGHMLSCSASAHVSGTSSLRAQEPRGF
ncbi:DSPTP1B [Symbiodinium necroappetens]|uniref:DSPTP1B protein n=1 Tax=Symbiodinium necroappetens TaxID=1628268 RepID=A0A812SSF6_9DINO|nr:DSPTP1B [Symbiodinium necroappetens]